MSLPKQIQDQLEVVEEFDRQLEAQQNAEAETVDEGVGVAEEQPAQPVEAQAPAEPVSAEPAPKPEPPTSEETWEHRYKTLDGKYKAEVPRLFGELRELKAELEAAQATIAELKRAPAEAQPKPKKLVTDEDVETFGPDLVDLIDRKAREVADELVDGRTAELRAENEKLREQLTGVSERQQSNDRQVFYAELERLVPDYEALNVDPGFLNWLAEVDQLSGVARQEYLNRAYVSFDATRTAALFNAYKQLTAPPVAPTPQSDSTLERQVAPSGSKASTPPPAAASTKIWRSGEIEAFYKQVSLGKFKDNEADRVRIEAEIDQAVAEGRVRA